MAIDFYEQLPEDLLIKFYHEINKTIEEGNITKSTYTELGLIISVMSRKGIYLEQPIISFTTKKQASAC